MGKGTAGFHDGLEGGDSGPASVAIAESLEVVRAIREGAVDAFVIGEETQPKVYTLMGVEHPYRMIIESMREGAVVLSMDGMILYSNESFARLIRAPIEKVLGETISRYIDSASVDRLGVLLSHRGSHQLEMTLRSNDGTAIPVLVSRSRADLVADEGICLIVTDLTDQKKHEKIVESERLTTLILEQAAEAILVCDTSGTIIQASRAAERLCGETATWRAFDELLSLRFAGETKPVGLEDLEDDLRFEVLAGRTISTLEVARTQPDGTTAYLMLSTSPIVDEGEMVGTMIILIEATDRMLARSALYESERKLRSQIGSLEERVAQRAAELVRANAALDALNRELRDLSFVASHFLQEPLRKIVAFGDLLANESAGVLSKDGSFYVGKIQSAARHMSDLIHDLLTFSRVTMRDGTFEPTNLSEIAAVVQEDLKEEIEESGGTVEVGDFPTIEANPSQMTELFRQLLSNAIRFRRADVQPEIKVSCREAVLSLKEGAEPQRAVQVEVQDNGIGFDPKYVDRMFSPFQQLHRTSHPGGTGIGLTICRRIVERHGGGIEAESVPGRGSRFIVRLPVRQAAE